MTIASLLVAMMLLSVGEANAEGVSLERLLAFPESYHLHIVTLKGTAHAVEPYRFILADDVTFIQVFAFPPRRRGLAYSVPPPISEGDEVVVDAVVAVFPSDQPGAKPTIEVRAIDVRRATQ